MRYSFKLSFFPITMNLIIVIEIFSLILELFGELA